MSIALLHGCDLFLFLGVETFVYSWWENGVTSPGATLLCKNPLSNTFSVSW